MQTALAPEPQGTPDGMAAETISANVCTAASEPQAGHLGAPLNPAIAT